MSLEGDAMKMSDRIGRAAGWAAGATGIALAGWAGSAALTWARYGHVPAPRAGDSDPILDVFMPPSNSDNVQFGHIHSHLPR